MASPSTERGHIQTQPLETIHPHRELRTPSHKSTHELTSPTLAEFSVEKLAAKSSTQKSSCEAGVGSYPPAPLSPINITLSQLCSLDYSQPGPEASNLPDPARLTAIEDSGYHSKNQTGAKSPSCQASECKTSPPQPHAAFDPRSLPPRRETPGFAENAKECLNDSLDDVLCEPHSQEPEQCGVRGLNAAAFDLLQEPADSRALKQGPVRPHLGSLLSGRTGDSWRRVPLQSVVGNGPPGRYTRSQLHSLGVHPSVANVSVTNAVAFRFCGSHYFSAAVLRGSPVCVGDGAMLRLAEGSAGVSEFSKAFSRSPGVDPKLVSYEWFANHYRWIVWKLAAMEAAFPRLFAGRCLTPDWLMLQLKYRYDREVDRAERPAIRKICEQDDVPSRTMVLCVSQIDWDTLSEGNLTSRLQASGSLCVNPNDSNLERSIRDVSTPATPCLELTDGWYSLPAVVDRPLRHMIRTGKIAVGTKLITYGAELVGDTAPVHPLEAPGTLALKLSTNSTRRARWYARLGYHCSPRPFPVSLSSVLPNGGLVGCTEAVVVRVYPMLYMEKCPEGGKNVFRNRRAEERVSRAHDAVRQGRIEAICGRVQREYEEEVERQGEWVAGKHCWLCCSWKLELMDFSLAQSSHSVSTTQGLAMTVCALLPPSLRAWSGQEAALQEAQHATDQTAAGRGGRLQCSDDGTRPNSLSGVYMYAQCLSGAPTEGS